MLNRIVIMGRLTRDPELRRTSSGTAVTSFTVACDRDYSGKDGDKQTDFIDCVAWRQTGEFISKYFTKGRMIVVDGRLELRDWTDKNGNKRRTAEINVASAYFGDSKKDGTQATNGGTYRGRKRDSMGRYSRNDAKHDIAEKLRHMADEAPDSRTREALEKAMRAMEE